MCIRDRSYILDWPALNTDPVTRTIAGLVIHEARAIPEAGQTFVFHDFRFELLRKSRNRITLLRVQPDLGQKADSAAR